MNTGHKIVVTPVGDVGFRVEVDGQPVGAFSNGGYATAAYADQVIEVRRLESVIREHVAWMHSRTPSQVNDLDAGRLRAIAEELKFKAGIE